jgi:hypothetical protein
VGALDDIVEPFRLTNKATKERCKQALIDLISIFAYLAGIIKKREKNDKAEIDRDINYLIARVKPKITNTQRVLPPLPKKVKDALEAYNSICNCCVQGIFPCLFFFFFFFCYLYSFIYLNFPPTRLQRYIPDHQPPSATHRNDASRAHQQLRGRFFQIQNNSNARQG